LKALKQIVNGIRVYSRHSAECNYAKEAAHVKCDCPKWLQFQVAGKQIRITANTRSFAQAKLAAQKKEKELSGEVTPATATITVEQAVQNWLAHRDQQKIDNAKAKLMSGKLLVFCRDRNIAFLAAVTKAHLSDFKLTLDFRSGDSNSLRVHLSVLGGFFRWAVDEAGYLIANPFPKFKLKFERPEIAPPTKEEVDRVCAIESVRVFASLMRFSGMAISDASTLKRSALTAGNLITGKRQKTNAAYRVRIPMWLADELRALPPRDAEYFFWDGTMTLESLAGQHRRQLDRAFKEAKVKMTSHRFRHFFVSTTLAAGVSVEDVSAMTGTSPNELRKTYRHYIKEAVDRLDVVQRQVWIKQGLDRNGNPQPGMARP
jgi:integrase/recombinase XerD